jgi:hypothetical protein
MRAGLGALAAMAVILHGAPAAAADMTWFVQGGDGDRAVKSATAGVTRRLYPFGLTPSSSISFYGEAVIGEWFVHDRRSEDRADFTQFGLTPVLRYAFGNGPFLEAGIGLDVIAPRFRDNDRNFSTKFNFADHLAIGTRFGSGGANEISFRAEHFSNGGIRHPNPGQNFAELRYARHF